MWAWQLFLAHFVGLGPFLASGQLSLVVRGGRDNERFSKFATLLEKGAFLLKLEQNLSIWGRNRKDKKTRAEKGFRTAVEFCVMDKRRPNFDPKTRLDLG